MDFAIVSNPSNDISGFPADDVTSFSINWLCFEMKDSKFAKVTISSFKAIAKDKKTKDQKHQKQYELLVVLKKKNTCFVSKNAQLCARNRLSHFKHVYRDAYLNTSMHKWQNTTPIHLGQIWDSSDIWYFKPTKNLSCHIQ